MTPRRSSPRIRPTKRAIAFGGGALLLFGVGTNVQAGWVLAIAALLLGMLIAGVILPLTALGGIEVARVVPRTAIAGAPVPVSLEVSNRSSKVRGLFRVRDDFLGRTSAVVGPLVPGATRSFVADRGDSRRGVYTSGRSVLESGFPFGVLRVRRSTDLDSPVVVHPRIYDATAWRSHGPSGWPAPAPTGDVSSVRDHRPGDPLRHIHWRSSARRGQLVVREFDREYDASTSVAADVPADRDVADAVASVACSIATSSLRDGQVAVGGQTMRSTDAICDWGARLEPGGPSASAQMVAADRQRADAVVYVGTAALAPVEALRAWASSASAVLIDDGTGADRTAGVLRSAGAVVAVVAPGEVEAWFRDGCAAS